VVRPSHEFLQGYRTSGLYRHAEQAFGAELFAKVHQAGPAREMTPSQLGTVENSLVKVAFRTGRDLDRFTAEDLIGLLACGRRANPLVREASAIRETFLSRTIRIDDERRRGQPIGQQYRHLLPPTMERVEMITAGPRSGLQGHRPRLGVPIETCCYAWASLGPSR
jgi:hypothetical protein